MSWHRWGYKFLCVFEEYCSSSGSLSANNDQLNEALKDMKDCDGWVWGLGGKGNVSWMLHT